MSLPRFSVRTGRTIVYFGINSVEALNKWVDKFKRVFIVTSRRAARISGALDDVTKILDAHGIKYEVFSEVFPNPTDSLVDTLAERIWRFGAEAVIAIGGGSVIDSAKMACIVVANGGRTIEYVKGGKEPRSSIPLAAVNLTHGTGTEADRYAVVTIEETREKLGTAHELLYPSISIDDPRYLTTLPKNQTLYTAIDAVFHAIESSTSRIASPYTEILAEKVIELVVKYLPRAVENPQDVEARYWLLYASMLAGIAIDHGRTHLVHAIEHALSGLKPELAHGAGLGIVGPIVLEHIYRARPDTCYRILRHLDPSLEPSEKAAVKAREALSRFLESVGFREKLRDYGFSEENAQDVVRLTLSSPLRLLVGLAPFQVDEKLVLSIYREALGR